jgi:hypothetical protein
MHPLGIDLVCVLAQRASPLIIAALVENHGQNPKGFSVFHLFLAHLEQYPLCGIQVPLQEESPSQFDFLGDIGLRCDQRLYSTRLSISRRPTTARGIDPAGGVGTHTYFSTRSDTEENLHPIIAKHGLMLELCRQGVAR